MGPIGTVDTFLISGRSGDSCCSVIQGMWVSWRRQTFAAAMGTSGRSGGHMPCSCRRLTMLLSSFPQPQKEGCTITRVIAQCHVHTAKHFQGLSHHLLNRSVEQVSYNSSSTPISAKKYTLDPEHVFSAEYYICDTALNPLFDYSCSSPEPHTLEELKKVDSRQGIGTHMESVDQLELLPGEYDIPAQKLGVVISRVQPWRREV